MRADTDSKNGSDDNKRNKEVSPLSTQQPNTFLKVANTIEDLKLKFELFVRQQPDRCRICGDAERGKRPLNPPPIVQLRILQAIKVKGDCIFEEVRPLDVDKFIVVCSLRTENNDDLSLSRGSSILVGNLVSNAYVGFDDKGKEGIFFFFPELSGRIEGRYCLCFRLHMISDFDVGNTPETKPSRVMAECMSNVFKIYSPKDFPGMQKSSPLTRVLASQGIKIPVRNEIRKKRKPPKIVR